MKAAAIIVAAGAGRRFNSKTPKQFLMLKNSPVFLWSVFAFQKVKSIKQVILVVPPNKLKVLSKLKYRYNIDVVAGGKERFNSVQNGLKKLKNEIDIVAIHDAARPLITAKVINKSLVAADKFGASVVSLPVNGTVKLSDLHYNVLKTIPRNIVWRAQTPQTFKRKIIETAYEGLKPKTIIKITDDAQVVELSGKKVKIVPGDPQNIKITEKRDLKLAESLLKNNK